MACFPNAGLANLQERICQHCLLGYGRIEAKARWNHAGYRIVYTAQSLSLASLEIWMHVDLDFPLPPYVSFAADIPADLEIHYIHQQSLPSDWTRPDHPALQDLGTDWLICRKTAVACVPSVATDGERNYLLNPEHPSFAAIVQGSEEKFEFKERMFKNKRP